jgi:hypothetical protein
MDMKLPVLDGLEATRVLKSDPELAAIPIVVISAAAMKEDENLIKSAGCDGFLTKPIRRAKLIEELARFLPYSLEKSDPPEAKADSLCEDIGDFHLLLEPAIHDRLPEMVQILRNDFALRWKKINNTYLFKDIELFANDMKAFGENFGSLGFSQWAEAVLSQARNFDMEKLPTTLNHFPQLVAAAGQLATGKQCDD